MSEAHIETPVVARVVEDYLSDLHREVAQYEKRFLVDESSEYDLHRLAARIYELGYADGRGAEESIEHSRHLRRKEMS